MKKCSGCGTIIQNTNPELEGYSKNIDANIAKDVLELKIMEITSK